MRIALLALAATGCQYLIGLEPTKDRSDAPPVMADAAPDAFVGPPVNVGSGKDGALMVTDVAYTDDVRTTLADGVLASSTKIMVASSAGFANNDDVLIMQMIGTNAGQWEIATVQSTLSTQLLTTPLKFSYEGTVQIIRVPNWTDVTITPTGTLTAHPWDGATGGVAAFRAKGTVLVQTGGKLTADALGFAPGSGGAGGIGGAGGMGGFGAGAKSCPGFCSIGATAGDGNAGKLMIGAAGGAGQRFDKCIAGNGGSGGQYGNDGQAGTAGGAGAGLGAGAVSGGGGTNTSPEITHLILGGGGAGGDGGSGGRGAGGGGGGGGSIGNTGSSNGGTGNQGGDGGDGGNGGLGGGIIIVQAQTITIAGTISARGADGVAATNAADGGLGGDGGFGGQPVSCNGFSFRGGRGGAGAGGDGGVGGGGGGAGAGGVMQLDAFAVTATGGDIKAVGGIGGALGPGGTAGPGGDGYDADTSDMNPPAAAGVDGVAGAPGGNGGSGYFYLRYVDSCTDCMTGDPPAILTHL